MKIQRYHCNLIFRAKTFDILSINSVTFDNRLRIYLSNCVIYTIMLNVFLYQKSKNIRMSFEGVD